MRLLVLCAAAIASSGCFDLDSFVWNARHCSTIDGTDADLCDERKLCTTCEKDYPFAAFGVPQELVTRVPVAVDGGENDAYLIESDGRRPDLTILYAHGNFGSIEHYLNRVALLWQTGARVFAIDYRGFGKSTLESEPTEIEFMADAQAARTFLNSLVDGPVAVVGFSAGALAAVEIARTSENCALVLENPWPNVQSFADDSTFIGVPQSFVTVGAWDNIGKMPKVEEPLLHLHGSEDSTVRLELGEELFAAANEPKELVIVERAGHGNFGQDVPTVLGVEYVDRITAHLDANCP